MQKGEALRDVAAHEYDKAVKQSEEEDVEEEKDADKAQEEED